jgi:hypothetical protein
MPEQNIYYVTFDGRVGEFVKSVWIGSSQNEPDGVILRFPHGFGQPTLKIFHIKYLRPTLATEQEIDEYKAADLLSL